MTIIIVTFNTRRFLPRQLAALAAQTEEAFELIILDNGSRPDDRPIRDLLPSGARLIQLEDNLGFAGGVNHAVAHCATPYVALLNPDAFPEPTWLAALLTAAQRWPNAACFGSTQLADDRPDVLDGVGDALTAFGRPYRIGHGKCAPPPADSQIFSACAAAALYRRTDFIAVNGFDDRFFCYCEDVDLGFRLRLVGRPSMQAPEAVVRHVGGGALTNKTFADYHGARNCVWLFCKNMPAPLFQLMLLPHLLACTLLTLTHVFDGRFAARARGFIAGLKGMPAALRQRRTIQAERSASVAEIARALTWSPISFARRAPKKPRAGLAFSI